MYKLRLYLYLIVQLRLRSFIYQLFGSSVFHGMVLADADNEGVLLFGQAGSGKTTIANEFTKEHNYKLISDDTIMLKYKDGSVLAYPFNNKVSFRKENGIPKLIRNNTYARAKGVIAIKRVYVLDNFVDYEAYLKSKIYNIHRIPDFLKNMWLQTHYEVIRGLLSIQPETL